MKNESEKSPFLFFAYSEPNIRAGGESGYLANLAQGFKLHNKELPLTKPSGNPIKLLTFWCPGKNFRHKMRRLFRRWLYGRVAEVSGKSLSRQQRAVLADKNLKWIFTETVTDFEMIRQFLSKANPKTKIVLMSHDPERPSDEIRTTWLQKLKTGEFSQKTFDKYCERMKKIERDAFLHADLILFPSREAMEPYFQTWSEFPEIIKGKKIHFLETGCVPLNCEGFSRERSIEKFGLNPNASLRICYIGRHQEVKGYDLLTQAAEKIWAKIPDAEFVIGGSQNPAFPPPNDSRWKECGFVNPPELLCAADVFVLPNRRTYFDLVLLEVLSSGVPVIATNTGGNKSVAGTISADGGKIFLCEPSVDGISDEIVAFAAVPAREREQIRAANIAAHKKYYSPEAFAQRYLQLFEELLDEK